MAFMEYDTNDSGERTNDTKEHGGKDMSGITILIIAAAGMAVLLGGVTPLPDKTKNIFVPYKGIVRSSRDRWQVSP